MRVVGVSPPNKQWYYDRCDALARALKRKEVMPPFLIVSMCQLLMVRAIGSPWRVIWFLILDRLHREWDRFKDNIWWSWHQYIRLRTHAECMELYETWLEKKTGYDCRDWPNEVEIKEGDLTFVGK